MRWGLVLAASQFLLGSAALAAQMGPVFPTHHYPTDTSYHLGYQIGRMGSNSNFIERLITDGLEGNSTLQVLRHQFSAEYQPNRRLSLGVLAQADQLSLSSGTEEKISKTGFSDQYFFTEFRFHDQPGSSLGFATVLKFPLYSNPTLAELKASENPNQTLLLGDGQFDMTLYMTGEYWLSDVVRAQADFGYTHRTDGFAAELPYMLGVGFVNPKMDLNVRFKGNFALGESSIDDPQGAFDQIREAFARSDYAYSPAPWTLLLEPSVCLWLNSRWGATLEFRMPLMGVGSPNYRYVGAGLRYRWAETRRPNRQSFREVDIGTDQEEGVFEGEIDALPELEAVPDSAILDEGERVFE